MAHDNDVNEMGLLDAFNYEVDEPQGQIDGSNDFEKKQKKKRLSLGKKQKSDDFTEISIKNDNNYNNIDNNNNNNGNNMNSGPQQSGTLSESNKFCIGIFYWIPIRSLGLFGGLALFILPIIYFR